MVVKKTKSVERKNQLVALRKEIAKGNTTNVIKRDKLGLLPLHRASLLSDELAVESILSTPAIDHINDNGEIQYSNSALHLACIGGNDNIIKLLIEKGASPNLKNKAGDTPLHFATFSEKCQLNTIKMLIDGGASVNSMNKALRISAQKGRKDFVQLLLDRGADVDLQNVEGKSNDSGEIRYSNSALHIACFEGYADIIKLLIEKGANPNLKNKAGDSPLHFATISEKCQLNTIKILINGGASVDSMNKDQVTPLHISAQKGRKDFVQLLLDRGADVRIQNVEGKSTLELCDNPCMLRIILTKMRTMESTDSSVSTSSS